MYRNTPTSGVFDLYLDLSYGVIFLLTLMVLWSKVPNRWVYLTFYTPLIALLCLTLFDRGGVSSSIENNIYVGLIVIALTMQSKSTRKFSLYLIGGTLVALVLVEMKYDFLTSYTGYSTSHFNYIFMAIGTIFITYMAKRVFENWKDRLSLIRKELSDNHIVLGNKQSELEEQTKELEALNRELENKVDERLTLLNEKKEAMKQYLDLTTRELQKEHKGVHQLALTTIGTTDDKIEKMILTSSQKLEDEINELVNKLKEEL